MDFDGLIGDLAAPDENSWRPAWNAFKELGGAGVPALVAELVDEESPLDWARAGTLLRQLGDPAFCAVRDAVAADLPEEPARRARWTLGGFSGEHWDRLLESLGHPSAAVRAGAALCLQRMGEEALPASGALIRMLGDADADVRQRAAWALEEIGPAVLDALREVRRSGPGAYRPGAFNTIVNIGGPDSLSHQDQQLWRRYVRAKAAADRPQEIWENSCFFPAEGRDRAAHAAVADLRATFPRRAEFAACGTPITSPYAVPTSNAPVSLLELNCEVLLNPEHDQCRRLCGVLREDDGRP